jgi:hypothetical protein
MSGKVNRKRIIGIFGAFDRMNYGDLLIPIITEKYLRSSIPNFDDIFTIKYFGIVKSNLKSYGGLKTNSINTYRKKAQGNDILIIAGGEVLTPKWELIYFYISETNYKFLYRIKQKVLRGLKIGLNHRINSTFPFVLSKTEFKNNPKIIYSSVGGTSFQHLSDAHIKKMISFLKEANYISVRDVYTELNIKKFHIESILEPDIAILVSKFFSPQIISTLVDQRLKVKIDCLDKKYFVFQMGINYFKQIQNKSLLYNKLKNISLNNDLEIILLPLGLAKGHEDNVVLSEIKQSLFGAILIDNPSIYEIIYTIISSNFVIATSLHANITAMSYGIKNLPLTDYDLKLPAFIKTWQKLAPQLFYTIEELEEGVKQILALEKGIWEEMRDDAIKVCESRKQKMIRIICSN